MKYIEDFIPLDKSWMIRMGILDLFHGLQSRSISLLSEQSVLSSDLQNLLECLVSWKTSQDIFVGESGTLLRFLKFLSWKRDENKNFLMHKTLLLREIYNNKEIIDFRTSELLELDGGTSQWASASVLCGSKERVDNPPFKLQLTYDAVEHWEKYCGCWELKKDDNIRRQMLAFLSNPKAFAPIQAEDYCFARIFDLISVDEGEQLWPQMKNHESNRLEEMEKALDSIRSDDVFRSNDHRAVQAYTLHQIYYEKEIKLSNKKCVEKSWPEFWNFIRRHKHDINVRKE